MPIPRIDCNLTIEVSIPVLISRLTEQTEVKYSRRRMLDLCLIFRRITKGYYNEQKKKECFHSY